MGVEVLTPGANGQARNADPNGGLKAVGPTERDGVPADRETCGGSGSGERCHPGSTGYLDSRTDDREWQEDAKPDV